MIGIFKDSGRKGAGREAIIHGIANGAKTLDCLGGHLGNDYKFFGFEEVGRDAWNDEYAPDGWDYEKEGRPDVVYFRYSEGLSRAPADVRGRIKPLRGEGATGGGHVSGVDSEIDTGNSRQERDRLRQREQNSTPEPAGVHPVDVTEDPQTEGRREGGFFVR